jgi:hypothetical protein
MSRHGLPNHRGPMAGQAHSVHIDRHFTFQPCVCVPHLAVDGLRSQLARVVRVLVVGLSVAISTTRRLSRPGYAGDRSRRSLSTNLAQSSPPRRAQRSSDGGNFQKSLRVWRCEKRHGRHNRAFQVSQESLSDQDRLRERISIDFPAINRLQRPCEDEAELAPAQRAATSFEHPTEASKLV